MTTKLNCDLRAGESTKMNSLSNFNYCQHRNAPGEDNEVFRPEKSFPFIPFLHHSCYKILFPNNTFS